MNKTVKKSPSDKSLEEITLVAESLAVFLQDKKNADAKIKPLKEQLVDYVEKHKDKLFADGKSFKLAGLEITIQSDHTYELGENFDLVKFYKKYPDSVKFSLSHVNMKNIPVTDHDIKHVEDEKINVGLEKVKA